MKESEKLADKLIDMGVLGRARVFFSCLFLGHKPKIMEVCVGDNEYQDGLVCKKCGQIFYLLRKIEL